MYIHDGELVFTEPTSNQSFKSSIEISLFTYARADDSYGWFFRDLGNTIWLFFRSKITPDVIRELIFQCEQSLQWLTDDGYANSIKVTARQSFDTVILTITINHEEGLQTFNFTTLQDL